MTLFTKPECVRCNELKTSFDLSALGVNVESLNPDNADALSHLAWHGLVETARKNLPILVLDDSSSVTDYEKIRHLLIERAQKAGTPHFNLFM